MFPGQRCRVNSHECRRLFHVEHRDGLPGPHQDRPTAREITQYHPSRGRSSQIARGVTGHQPGSGAAPRGRRAAPVELVGRLAVTRVVDLWMPTGGSSPCTSAMPIGCVTRPGSPAQPAGPGGGQRRPAGRWSRPGPTSTRRSIGRGAGPSSVRRRSAVPASQRARGGRRRPSPGRHTPNARLLRPGS